MLRHIVYHNSKQSLAELILSIAYSVLAAILTSGIFPGFWPMMYRPQFATMNSRQLILHSPFTTMNAGMSTRMPGILTAWPDSASWECLANQNTSAIGIVFLLAWDPNSFHLVLDLISSVNLYRAWDQNQMHMQYKFITFWSTVLGEPSNCIVLSSIDARKSFL